MRGAEIENCVTPKILLKLIAHKKLANWLILIKNIFSKK